MSFDIEAPLRQGSKPSPLRAHKKMSTPNSSRARKRRLPPTKPVLLRSLTWLPPPAICCPPQEILLLSFILFLPPPSPRFSLGSLSLLGIRTALHTGHTSSLSLSLSPQSKLSFLLPPFLPPAPSREEREHTSCSSFLL